MLLTDAVIRPVSAGDWPAIADLLSRSELPLAGAEEELSRFVVATVDGQVIGCAGLEHHAGQVLLRSVAVAGEWRRLGLGGRLVAHLVERARQHGAAGLVLLTESAAGYFPRFGFRPVDRESVPAAVKASVEFTTACAESAQAMVLDLA